MTFTERTIARAETRPPMGLHFARSLDWNLLKTFYEIIQAASISEAARQTSRQPERFGAGDPNTTLPYVSRVAWARPHPADQ